MEHIQSKRNGSMVTVMLRGEIDHCSAETMKRHIETWIQPAEITHLHFDFSGVEFMDSSAVGMIIGRYKTMAAKRGKTTASGLYPPVDRLFRMAGLHRIITIETLKGKDKDEKSDGIEYSRACGK